MVCFLAVEVCIPAVVLLHTPAGVGTVCTLVWVANILFEFAKVVLYILVELENSNQFDLLAPTP